MTRIDQAALRGACQLTSVNWTLSGEQILRLFNQVNENLARFAPAQESDPKDALWQFCQAFINKQNIHCAETIYQTDRVIENAYEFIDGVCKIVGFKKDEE